MDSIVAIDGPAGSGKSTIAKLLAKKFKFDYIDTGAMYRAVTFHALQNEAIGDETRIVELARKCKIDLEYRDGEVIVLLNVQKKCCVCQTENIKVLYPKPRKKEEV